MQEERALLGSTEHNVGCQSCYRAVILIGPAQANSNPFSKWVSFLSFKVYLGNCRRSFGIKQNVTIGGMGGAIIVCLGRDCYFAWPKEPKETGATGYPKHDIGALGSMWGGSGPAMRPRERSFPRHSSTISGLFRADGLFLWEECSCCLRLNPILKPLVILDRI